MESPSSLISGFDILVEDNLGSVPLKLPLLDESLDGDFEVSSGFFFYDNSLSFYIGSSPGPSLLN